MYNGEWRWTRIGTNMTKFDPRQTQTREGENELKIAAKEERGEEGWESKIRAALWSRIAKKTQKKKPSNHSLSHKLESERSE